MTDSYRPGRTLRDRRIALGLTREALATATGTSASTIYRVEAGRTTPNVSTLVVIRGVLGLTADDRGVLDLTADDLDLKGLAAGKNERASR